MKKTDKQIENCLSSDLQNMLSEFKMNQLTDELIISYFKNFLLDSNVDSTIIVKVLERDEFGELGKEAALGIKINEGW